MESIVLFTNPFDETINQLIDFVDDMKTDHLYNSIYKVTLFIDPQIYKDTLAMISEVNYSYLYFCTNIQSNSLNDFIDLYNHCINDFLGVYASRIEVVYYEVRDDIYVKLIPHIGVNRIYLSDDLISSFRIQYQDILKLNHLFVSSDPLFHHAQKLLENKSITAQVVQVDSLVASDNSNYSDKVDTTINKLKQENIFSLYEFKDDPLYLIISEVIKAFDITQVHDYVFKYQMNPFHVCIKTWLIDAALRILDNQLPIYRSQVDNNNENDEELRAKLRVAAILSYLKIKDDINIDVIQVLEDMTVLIPVLNMEMITVFNEYMSGYLTEVDNWTATLCPSLAQAVTLRSVVSKSKLSRFDSYIVNIDDSEYLVVRTTKPEIIKYNPNIALSEVTSNSRGFITKDSEPFDVDVKVEKLKCGNIIKYGDQVLDGPIDKYRNIKSEWIRFYAKSYNVMSNLILFI